VPQHPRALASLGSCCSPEQHRPPRRYERPVTLTGDSVLEFSAAGTSRIAVSGRLRAYWVWERLSAFSVTSFRVDAET
jgi:hypothetical protein